MNNRKSLINSEILLIHVDNYTKFNLNRLLSCHKKRPPQCLLTMITFITENPKSCGIVETDNEGVVTAFFEKVDNPPSNIANGAIYIFDDNLIDYISENIPNAIDLDFSKDVIPYLIGRILPVMWKSNLLILGLQKLCEKQMKTKFNL